MAGYDYNGRYFVSVGFAPKLQATTRRGRLFRAELPHLGSEPDFWCKAVSVENTENGEVSGETVFHYRQRDALIWSTYEGGAVLFGTLVGKAGNEGRLDFRYQHLNERGEFMTGEYETRLQVLKDGRYRLHESWRWPSGDCSSGRSVVEEIER